MFYDITAPPTESHSLRAVTNQEAKPNLSKNRTKSRVKSSSKRLFLDDSLSDEEKVDEVSGGKMNAFGNKNPTGHESEEPENRGNGCVDAEDCSYDNSWTCPLTFDELSPSPSNPDTQESSGVLPLSRSAGPRPAVRSTKCSGVILKLRRMFSERLHRKKSCYQAVLDSRAFANPSLLQTTKGEGEVSGGMDVHRRAASFPPTLRSLRSASKRKRRSLLKIKYCPYLSACHSAEHRRRWVLRSAVQRAQRAMRLYNLDLVGKRIRHLYEEDDKSEVWYRGEVLRVHEAHVNPLKTVFEVRYDSEPEWKYYLELLMDYKKGWLKIED